MTGFGRNYQNATCIIGTSDSEIHDSVPPHDGIKSLKSLFVIFRALLIMHCFCLRSAFFPKLNKSGGTSNESVAVSPLNQKGKFMTFELLKFLDTLRGTHFILKLPVFKKKEMFTFK